MTKDSDRQRLEALVSWVMDPGTGALTALGRRVWAECSRHSGPGQPVEDLFMEVVRRAAARAARRQGTIPAPRADREFAPETQPGYELVEAALLHLVRVCALSATR